MRNYGELCRRSSPATPSKGVECACSRLSRALSLSLSLSVRESELLPVIPPANLRRPIPRWNATFLLHFRFFLSLSLSFKKAGNKIHAKICPFVQSELFGKILFINERFPRNLWQYGFGFRSIPVSPRSKNDFRVKRSGEDNNLAEGGFGWRFHRSGIANSQWWIRAALSTDRWKSVSCRGGSYQD